MVTTTEPIESGGPRTITFNGAAADRVTLPQALGERIDIMPVVESLRPLIVASQPSMEKNRRLPQELVEAMHEAGIFASQLPREAGGLELHPLDYLDLVFELSRISGAVGWISVIQNGAFPLLKPALMRELIDKADGRWNISGSHGRIGKARKVDGGYRLSGTWVFASGIPWATYVTAYAEVYDEHGMPVIDPFTGGPTLIDAVVPRVEITYLDGWNSLGLRGTGSGMFSLDDHFVEERMTMSGLADEAYMDRAIYRGMWITDMAAILLGITQSALDHVAALNETQVREDVEGGGEQLRPMQFAHADATVRSTRRWVWEATTHAFDVAINGNEREKYESFIQLIQANMYTARVCSEAVDELFELAGLDAVRTGRGFERIFRDLSTGMQHTGLLQRNNVAIGEFRITEHAPDGPVTGPDDFVMPPPPPVGTWSVDPLHSTVGFAIKHNAVGTFRATFTEFDARFYEEQGRFKGSVQTASLKTFSGLRSLLLGAEFLAAEQHPQITFASTSIATEGDEIQIDGDLTLNGVTKPISARGRRTGPSKVAAFALGLPNEAHIGLDLEAVIDRRDFGMGYNNELLSGHRNLGWNVTLEFSLELTKAID